MWEQVNLSPVQVGGANCFPDIMGTTLNASSAGCEAPCGPLPCEAGCSGAIFICLVGGEQWLIVVLICSSLMMSEVRWLFALIGCLDFLL